MTDKRNLSFQPTLDVMVEIIRHSVKPLPDVLIKRSFPALVQCILRSEDYTVIQVSLIFAKLVVPYSRGDTQPMA